MVTGIATAMLDSSPIVCITGQVGSKLIGSDAFQESDVTGVSVTLRTGARISGRVEFDGAAARPDAGRLQTTFITIEPGDGSCGSLAATSTSIGSARPPAFSTAAAAPFRGLRRHGRHDRVKCGV